MHFDITHTDILVVGAGLAGLYTALNLSPLKVSIIAAAPLLNGASSVWAQGGIAAAFGEGDTPEQHAQDTMIAGCYLNDPEIVNIITREATMRVKDLFDIGVRFDIDNNGRFIQGKEAAHSTNRIVKVGGDGAGRYILEKLTENVLNSEHIQIQAPYVIFDFAKNASGEIVGVYARKLGNDKPVLFCAKKIILATGGVGSLYADTTNPHQIRGEALGIGIRHGIRVKDLEFVQFHPTAIDVNKSPCPLATEALRGEGAVLINQMGERFMTKTHPDAELAPRDIVARAVAFEYKKGNSVFLDTRQALGQKIVSSFPTVSHYCLSHGIDPITMPIPIKPAQHYHMGGIYTDSFGKTSLPNLFAVGEVAGTGAHGANRLASNSLLEAVVFSGRVAELILNLDLKNNTMSDISLPIKADRLYPKKSAYAMLRQQMSAYVGLLRTQNELELAKKTIYTLDQEGQFTAPFTNYAHAAIGIIEAAMARKKSIGAHFRTDDVEKITI